MEVSLSLEQKIDFAERASAVRVDELDAFCVEAGLPLQDVTSWSTAWHTGGELAVQALVVHWRPSFVQTKQWKEDVRSGLKFFRPRAIRMTEDGNRFTVEEAKALTVTSIVHSPICQLRVVLDGEGVPLWFLYWRRAGGSWWPYAGKASFATAYEALAEVKADPHRCFRLHPLA